MNWRQEAVEDLKMYTVRREACRNVADRIKTLDGRLCSTPPVTSDTVPDGNGNSRIENWRLNAMTERERLTENYKTLRRYVALTDRGLASLTETERRVLEVLYIRRRDHAVEKLQSEMCCKPATVYNTRDRALYKYALSMYGAK